MRRSYLLLILVISLIAGQHAGGDGFGVSSEAHFRHLILTPAVSDNLALLFEKFDTELVLCLEGERRGADLHVTDFRMPHIFRSEIGRVQAASCAPGTKALGTWHNHPNSPARRASADTRGLDRNCYLSRTDIDDFRRRQGALIAVVSCAPRTYAYWGRSDVDSVAADAVALLPIPGQLIQSEIGFDPAAERLTQARER